MALSMMQRCLVVIWSVLTIGLAVTGAEAQSTVMVTMRLAEAEWHVVRQEVLPRFEAVCNYRVRAIDVPPETLVQRLRAMQQAWRMEIDLFAQDNMRLQELVDTALAAPGAPRSGGVRPPCLTVILGKFALATYLTLGAKTMPPQVYYYLYQGNWFDTAVAATLMTVPVLILSAFLQRYLCETNLAGVMR